MSGLGVRLCIYIIISYSIGYIGVPFPVILPLLFGSYAVEKWVRRRFVHDMNKKAENERAASLLSNKNAEVSVWLNIIIRSVWQNFRPYFENYTKDLLDKTLLLFKPEYITEIRVSRMLLSENEPYITKIYSCSLPKKQPERFDMEIGLVMVGQSTVTIRVNLMLGITVPVQVRMDRFECRLHITGYFVNRPPWLGTVEICFVNRPIISIDVKPTAIVNLMDVPLASEFLKSFFSETCMSFMTAPSSLRLPFDEWQNPINSHELLLTKEKEKVLSCGIVTIEMKELMFDEGGEYYFKLKLGDQILKSEKSIKCKSKIPVVLTDVIIPIKVKDPDNDVILMEFFEKNKITSDERIGHFELNVFDMGEGINHEMRPEICDNDKPNGRAYLSVQYKSFKSDEDSRRTILQTLVQVPNEILELRKELLANWSNPLLDSVDASNTNAEKKGSVVSMDSVPLEASDSAIVFRRSSDPGATTISISKPSSVRFISDLTASPPRSPATDPSIVSSSPSKLPIVASSSSSLNATPKSAILQVRLLGAKYYTKTPLDSYCSLAVDQTSVKSNIIKNSLSPSWDDLFEFILKSDSKELVICAMEKKNRFSKDSCIFQTSINLDDVPPDGLPHDMILECNRKGIVHVSLKHKSL